MTTPPVPKTLHRLRYVDPCWSLPNSAELRQFPRRVATALEQVTKFPETLLLLGLFLSPPPRALIFSSQVTRLLELEAPGLCLYSFSRLQNRFGPVLQDTALQKNCVFSSGPLSKNVKNWNVEDHNIACGSVRL
jgi:hypothetical protein